MERVRSRALRCLFLLALALTGCGGSAAVTEAPASAEASVVLQDAAFANGTVVDNIRVGLRTECSPDPECATRVTLARAAAVERHGLSPTAIGVAHFYSPYIPPGATLGGGGSKIVVFDLDDGSHAAVTTYCMDTCFVVAPQPVQPLTLESPSDHGPLVDPFVESPRDCKSTTHPTCNEAVRVAIDAATSNGFLAPGTIGDAHYYVTYVTPDSPEAGASKAEYIIDIYIAGEHETLAETAIGVRCEAGPCEAVFP